jgi:hypothetical protein
VQGPGRLCYNDLMMNKLLDLEADETLYTRAINSLEQLGFTAIAEQVRSNNTANAMYMGREVGRGFMPPAFLELMDACGLDL